MPLGQYNSIQPIQPMNKDGSSAYDETLDALDVREIAPAVQETLSTLLFDAQVINDTVTQTSSEVDVSLYRTLVALCVVTVSAGTPTSLSFWLEYKDENDNWVGANSTTHGVPLQNSVGTTSPRRQWTAAADEVLRIPAWGKTLRANLVGAGTDGSNTFTATITLQAKGN